MDARAENAAGVAGAYQALEKPCVRHCPRNAVSMQPDHLAELRETAENAERLVSKAAALAVLTGDVALEDALDLGAVAREKFFGRGVRLHVLNNVRNGHCPEDCGYCAQRKVGGADVDAQPIASYPAKSEAEVLEEARAAYESGAFRYCMVTAGRGPNAKSVERFANLIRTIKEKYPLEVCLSAGILTDADFAKQLADAGLDRYNHNLNTSERHYAEICSTHDYVDRVRTLDTLRGAGVELCSGVIAGMGEEPADLVDTAFALRERAVPSIPVNFFIPVPGHAIENVSKLTPEYCLRILAMFRLVNPAAEVRIAAGRELHLGDHQPRALRVANSLFVAGYLNVKGSDAADTIRLIYGSGFEIDVRHSDAPEQLRELLEELGAPAAGNAVNDDSVVMKDLSDLRPFVRH